MCVSVLNQISMRHGGSGLEGAARQEDSFICLFFISRPQSTGTDSPHSSWYQNNVPWYIVSSAELTQGKGTKVIEELDGDEECIAENKM